MTSLFGLFSVFSIFYALVLIILFLGKGLLQIIWPIILLVCLYQTSIFEINPETDMFVINETLVPVYIFHPMSLLSSPILAFFFALSIRLGISDSRRFS